ncbi:MAG: VCBS domain-containing protein, partial [Azonexus sp.]|nr:VCBS domain-containing protein [Azonexus sp.]
MKRLQPAAIGSRLRMMKLEARLLFDGAAVAQAAAADQSHDAGPPDDASQAAPIRHANSTPADSKRQEFQRDPADPAISYFDAGGLPPEFQQAAESASQSILDFARQATDWQWQAIFDAGNTSDPAWQARLSALREGLLDGTLTVNVQAISPGAMPNAVAAFTAQGPDGGPTIFVNTAWTSLLGAPDLTRTLVEEYGHAIDNWLSAGRDSAGDEGERFAQAALNWNLDPDAALQRMALEQDRRVIEWEGASYQIETATFTFADSYEILDANPAKEQSSFSFDKTDSKGVATIDDDNYNNAYVSGNDVSAIGIDVGGETFYGWISRTVKVGGVVTAFYFWTDVEFTDLASAQQDGNQDGDGNPADNRGFVLVVDPIRFQQQIAGGNNIVNLSTSSDRVDKAINEVIEEVINNPNPPPPLVTAVADIADGEPGNGDPAVEGVDGAPGLAASGNVLNNDSTANVGASLQVTQISNASSISNVVGGSLPSAGVVVGQYGTLTMNADGSYTYVLNDTLPAVDSLNDGDRLQ